jgi:BirA family biotin operon repressor/biotin-[acetyl-CoA-carboxylase] ligase
VNYTLSWYLRRHADERHSVDDLASALGMSREQLSIHLEELRREGFRLDLHPTLGLHLAGTPAVIDRDEIAAARAGRRLGRAVHVYDRTRSTNDVAARLAAGGPSSDGLVVTAEEQEAGRGRQGAAWFGTRGESLLVSVIHWAECRPEAAAEITLAAGVATAEALGEVARVRAGIKWPNDVEIARRKVAGILVERPGGNGVGASGGETGTSAYIVGIGVNVNQPADRFPEDISGRATSLREATGQLVDRTLLLECLLDRLETLLDTLSGGSKADLLNRYAVFSDMIGRHVLVRESGQTFSGSVASISPHYALVVRLDDGGYRSFEASKVHLL